LRLPLLYLRSAGHQPDGHLVDVGESVVGHRNLKRVVSERNTQLSVASNYLKFRVSIDLSDPHLDRHQLDVYAAPAASLREPAL
jgi:hypothetical protein